MHTWEQMQFPSDESQRAKPKVLTQVSPQSEAVALAELYL